MEMMILPSRKKGLIFALDAALAVTVVVLMVINSTYYFSLGGASSLAHLQSVRLADDIVTVLDYRGDADAVVINASAKLPINTYTIPERLFNVSKYLPPNYKMWVSISDLTETVVANPCAASQSLTTKRLERNMQAFLQVNVTRVTPGATLKLTTVTTVPDSHTLAPAADGIYHMGIYTLIRKSGTNDVSIDMEASGLCLEWFRVLGSEAYAGSTDENLVLPTDRFIGSGERIFSVKKAGPSDPTGNPIEGTHLIRYLIWLKGAS